MALVTVNGRVRGISGKFLAAESRLAEIKKSGPSQVAVPGLEITKVTVNFVTNGNLRVKKEMNAEQIKTVNSNLADGASFQFMVEDFFGADEIVKYFSNKAPAR